MEGGGEGLRIIPNYLAKIAPPTKQCPLLGPSRDNGCLSKPEQLTQFWDDDDALMLYDEDDYHDDDHDDDKAPGSRATYCQLLLNLFRYFQS